MWPDSGAAGERGDAAGEGCQNIGQLTRAAQLGQKRIVDMGLLWV